MVSHSFEVKALVKLNGKTVAVDLLDLSSGQSFRVPRDAFPMLRGQLSNAVVSGYVIRARSGSLPVVTSELPEGQVRTFTVMYEDEVVVTVGRASGKVVVYRQDLLPFGLRGLLRIDAASVLSWIEKRVTNLSRKYMNLVYVARGVDRDVVKVLQDSCGVAITDHFWVRTSDVTVTWGDLVRLRDMNKALSELALSGNLCGEDLRSGYTSLFTVKGHYPKAILNDCMYKLREDALSDYLASYIGKQLGISVQSCHLENDLVRIELFTSMGRSLVHACEVKSMYGFDVDLVQVFTLLKRLDLVSQLQRLFIFNYVIGNLDLHDENYGFLYDAKSFEILSVSPCFDHNLALLPDMNTLLKNPGVASQFEDLKSRAFRYIGSHLDLVERLRCLDLDPIRGIAPVGVLSALRGRIDGLLGCV